MENKKIAGVVCDNFKVQRFEKEITKSGFLITKVTPMSGKLEGTTTISVEYTAKTFARLQSVIKKIEFSFKNSN